MKDTNIFEYKVANGVDKPAIWFHLNNKEVIVHPYGLYNILSDCYGERDFSHGIKAHFQIFKDEVCGYFHDDSVGYYHIDFQRESFIESIQQSLKALCEAVLSGKEIIYEDVKSVSAKKLLIGLENIVVPQSYYQILRDEIDVEPFSFNFVEPYDIDTGFGIKIGRQEFHAYLSDWSTDFNRLRIYIEEFVLHMSSEIKLYFEDSPTIIRINRRTIYNSNYWAIKKDIVRVVIIPNDFIKEPNVYGWCEPHQLISSLYLGLLNLCIVESNYFDDDTYGRDWGKFRLATYNKLQSCVIEDYILGIEEDEFAYRPRQRVINTVDEMLNDYRNLQNTLSI